jgi:mannosyltransferase
MTKVTIKYGNSSLHAIWVAGRATEQPHVLYYILMKPWFAAFGDSVFSARLPAVICGALAAAVLTMVGTRLLDHWVGLVAGLAWATSFFGVRWEQWARSIMLAMLLLLIATYALLRILEEIEQPPSRWIWVWSLTMIAACWANPFSVSVLAAHAIAFLVHPGTNRQLRPALIVTAVTFAAILPNIILVATANNGQLSWIPPLTLHRFLSHSWSWSGRNPPALLAAALGIYGLFKLATRSTIWKPALLCAWLASPFLLLFALDFFQNSFDLHYVYAASPALALLVAAGLVWVCRQTTVGGATLLFFIAFGATVELTRYYIDPRNPLFHGF